jgi:hypothetical protein
LVFTNALVDFARKSGREVIIHSVSIILRKREVHLHDHPRAAAFFERARPAAIIPPNWLAVPLRVVVEKARIPGGVPHLGKFDTQITDGEVGGLE